MLQSQRAVQTRFLSIDWQSEEWPFDCHLLTFPCLNRNEHDILLRLRLINTARHHCGPKW